MTRAFVSHTMFFVVVVCKKFISAQMYLHNYVQTCSEANCMIVLVNYYML